ncbi:hypothetical protein Xen7305DRAFT_00036020 [Xenococcus sp. PCC 7305]|nr:hypothetical protein Xen7305DRAFT_00036020 [Xenococcus sp. PCC 7305]
MNDHKKQKNYFSALIDNLLLLIVIVVLGSTITVGVLSKAKWSGFF